MAKTGGKREGAGRPAGAATLITRDIANRAAQEGITPLEYMLALLRRDIPDDLDIEAKASMEALKFEAAKAAAPYIHPRLAAIEMSGSLTLSHEQLLDDLG